MISKNPLLQLISKNPTYRNNLLINRSNVIVWIITTAVLFFFVVILIQSVISLYTFFSFEIL